jgi:hypothetical protein
MIEIFRHHRLTIHLSDIAGGLPADPRLVDAWQEANWRKSAKLLPGDPADSAEAAQRTGELLEGIPEEKGFTVFPRGPGGVLCIEGRQVKAALKESANILRQLVPVGTPKKVVPLRSKLAERVFVVERLLPFTPETTEPDDVIERAIHVMTAQGPRDAIKRSEIVKGRDLICTLKVLNDGLFTHEVLGTLLEHMAENGLGADRSQGFGRFTYELE